jgi:hypothetical protein
MQLRIQYKARRVEGSIFSLEGPLLVFNSLKGCKIMQMKRYVNSIGESYQVFYLLAHACVGIFCDKISLLNAPTASEWHH